MRSPGWRRVGGSLVRGPGRGRVTAGATDVGRRETGSSSEPAGTAAGAIGAIGAPTPASTGSGAGTGAAAAVTGGAAATAAAVSGGADLDALGAADVTGPSRPTGGGLAGASVVTAGVRPSSFPPPAASSPRLLQTPAPFRAGVGAGPGADA